MRPSIITSLLWLLKLASAIRARDFAPACRDKFVQVVVEDFYKTAGTNMVNLENELSAWPRQCGGISFEIIQRAINLQQDIVELTRTAAIDADCANGYSRPDLKKQLGWIPELTMSFISAMKGWDNAHEMVKAAGQEQAVLKGLRDLKEANTKFRNIVYEALRRAALAEPVVSQTEPSIWVQIE
jgi:hypothetical protein